MSGVINDPYLVKKICEVLITDTSPSDFIEASELEELLTECFPHCRNRSCCTDLVSTWNQLVFEDKTLILVNKTTLIEVAKNFQGDIKNALEMSVILINRPQPAGAIGLALSKSGVNISVSILENVLTDLGIQFGYDRFDRSKRTPPKFNFNISQMFVKSRIEKVKQILEIYAN